MQKAQVFLRPEQQTALKEIARRTGAKRSELIRRGVDLVIAEESAQRRDWQAAVDKAFGMWRDRPEVEDELADVRAQLARRVESSGDA